MAQITPEDVIEWPPPYSGPQANIEVEGAEFSCKCVTRHDLGDLKGVTGEHGYGKHSLNGTYYRDGNYLGLPMYTCKDLGAWIRVQNDVCVGDAVFVKEPGHCDCGYVMYEGECQCDFKPGVVTAASHLTELFDVQMSPLKDGVYDPDGKSDLMQNVAGSCITPDYTNRHDTSEGDRVIVIGQKNEAGHSPANLLYYRCTLNAEQCFEFASTDYVHHYLPFQIKWSKYPYPDSLVNQDDGSPNRDPQPCIDGIGGDPCEGIDALPEPPKLSYITDDESGGYGCDGCCDSLSDKCPDISLKQVAFACCAVVIIGFIVGLILACTIDWGDTTLSEDWIQSTCTLTGIESTQTVCAADMCQVQSPSTCGCGILSSTDTDTCDGNPCVRRRARNRRRVYTAVQTKCTRRRGATCREGVEQTKAVTVTSTDFSGVRVGTKCPEEIYTDGFYELSGWLTARMNTEVPCWYNPSGDTIEYPFDSNVRLDETSNCNAATAKALTITLLAIGLGLAVVGICVCFCIVNSW